MSQMFMKNGGSQPAAQVKSPAISSMAVGGIGRQNTGALTAPHMSLRCPSLRHST